MRTRDLTRLESAVHDVLVVGGGIQGLTIAYECASRGLTVALVEAGDFGGGASFNHQKTAHGGLRSLSTGRIGRAREAIRERRALARIAPWLLRPLPFLMGTYRSAIRSRVALAAAFKVDGWLGRHRNDGVEPELHLPAARLVSKAATIALFHGIRRPRLTGGAQWYDYQMVESDRLTIAFAAAADRAGADLANHVEALDPLKENGRIAGMYVRDGLTGRTFAVRARLTVNAAGSRAGVLMAAFGILKAFPLLKAMNLVTSKRASDIALAALAEDGRMLTLVPWRGRALVGTWQSRALVEPDDTAARGSEVDTFIRQANAAFPALDISRADVTLVHRGVVPAQIGRDGVAELRPDPEIVDHAAQGAQGALTVIGVKYTTARGVAERAADAIGKRLGKRLSASRTAVTPLPGAAIADHEALAIEAARAARLEVPTPAIGHLIALYAEATPRVISLMAEREGLRAPLVATSDTIGAEVVHVIRSEMAMRLTDIVLRRTGLGSAGHPGRAAIERCAEIAAAELGWDPARTAAEIDALEKVYLIE